MTEFTKWVEEQPRGENGKVDGRLLIAESQKRGYCVCPKELRSVISFEGCTCVWCGQPETRESWNFYYLEGENE